MTAESGAVAHEAGDVERRFGGLARLYGVEGAARIRAAHVAVVGIGGVGAWAAVAVARRDRHPRPRIPRTLEDISCPPSISRPGGPTVIG